MATALTDANLHQFEVQFDTVKKQINTWNGRISKLNAATKTPEAKLFAEAYSIGKVQMNRITAVTKALEDLKSDYEKLFKLSQEFIEQNKKALKK